MRLERYAIGSSPAARWALRTRPSHSRASRSIGVKAGAGARRSGQLGNCQIKGVRADIETGFMSRIFENTAQVCSD